MLQKAALIDSLVRETGRLLGKDAGHLRDKITLHRAFEQDPNWGDLRADDPRVQTFDPRFRA